LYKSLEQATKLLEDKDAVQPEEEEEEEKCADIFVFLQRGPPCDELA